MRPGLSALAERNAESGCGLRLADKSSRGGLDPLFEIGHQLGAGPSGRYRLKEFEYDPAGTFDKAPPPPENAGTDRGRNQRQGQRLVQSSDAGLIGKMLPGRDPGSLREDHDWSS